LKRCLLKLQELTRLRFREFSANSDYNIIDKKSPLNNSEVKPQFELKRDSFEEYKNVGNKHDILDIYIFIINIYKCDNVIF